MEARKHRQRGLGTARHGIVLTVCDRRSGAPFGALLGVGTARHGVVLVVCDGRSGTPFDALLGLGGVRKDVVFDRFWGSIAVWDPYFRTKSIVLFCTLLKP